MATEKCRNCGSTNFRDTTYPESVAVGGRLFEEALPARVCTACGWGYVKRSEFADFEKRVAKALLDGGVEHRAAEAFIDRVEAEKKKKAKAKAAKKAEAEAKVTAKKSPAKKKPAKPKR